MLSPGPWESEETLTLVALFAAVCWVFTLSAASSNSGHQVGAWCEKLLKNRPCL